MNYVLTITIQRHAILFKPSSLTGPWSHVASFIASIIVICSIDWKLATHDKNVESKCLYFAFKMKTQDQLEEKAIFGISITTQHILDWSRIANSVFYLMCFSLSQLLVFFVALIKVPINQSFYKVVEKILWYSDRKSYLPSIQS